MKTSIVAVVAASLFLVAAYMGLGSSPGTPPGPPQMIALSGPSSNAATPMVGDLPPVVPSSPAGPSQVLAVGRQVQQGSLKELARAATPGGPVDVAAGPPATPGQQFNATVNADIVPLSRSGSGASSPPSNVAKPGPGPVQTPVTLPTIRPRPEPSATPIPNPPPTPTPTPVTITVTPTSTVAPSTVSPTPPPHP